MFGVLESHKITLFICCNSRSKVSKALKAVKVSFYNNIYIYIYIYIYIFVAFIIKFILQDTEGIRQEVDLEKFSISYLMLIAKSQFFQRNIISYHTKEALSHNNDKD